MVLLAMCPCFLFLGNNLHFWQQSGLFRETNGPPFSNNSIRYNQVLVFETSFGNKECALGIVSPIIWWFHLDYLHTCILFRIHIVFYNTSSIDLYFSFLCHYSLLLNPPHPHLVLLFQTLLCIHFIFDSEQVLSTRFSLLLHT